MRWPLYVNAVLRDITMTFRRRDRSVVRSSVIPSAKYCWSRSSLRSVKGSTTIDSLGAGVNGAAAVGALAIGGRGVGHPHHAVPPATTNAAAAAAIIKGARLRCGLPARDTLAAGRPTTVSGDSA